LADLLFPWARLRAVGIGYAMAAVARERAAHPDTDHVAILDAGEDAGLALAAMHGGADRVLFSGPAEAAAKLAQIAAQLGVEFRN
jgi:hypothetical protein